jgi:plasmid maintenance system antidote protein VapI
MLSFKVIREQLEDCSLVKVSKKIGVTYPTIRRIIDGEENVSVNTLKKISDYIYSKQLNKSIELTNEEDETSKDKIEEKKRANR